MSPSVNEGSMQTPVNHRAQPNQTLNAPISRRQRREKAAFVISLVGAVFSIINAIPFFITGYKMQGLMAVINCLLYLSILLALKKREPKYYCPYLVIHGLIIGILMVCSVVILFSGILYNPRSDDEKHMRNVIIAYGVIICIYSAVLTFFWSIIFRSYRYMVENY